MNLFDKVFPPRTITLANGKQIKKPRSRAPLYAVVLLVMAAVCAAFAVWTVSPPELPVFTDPTDGTRGITT